MRLFLPGGRSVARVLSEDKLKNLPPKGGALWGKCFSVHHRPLIAVEEHGDGAGAAVRADDRADVAQADPAAELREALLERVDPVSYTHLDVYKRQGVDRLDVPDAPGKLLL